ncbi:MAG TPA: hypothetical protein DEB06_09915 [Phycisphaerales bacterium]|nr:hypothetical protein [Phycisphaerales bacterium]
MEVETGTVVKASRWTLRRWSRWLGAAAVMGATAGAALAGADSRPTAEESETLAAPASGALRLENFVGEIEVVAVEGATEVKAEVLKRGQGRSQKEAEEALDEISVSLSPDAMSPGTLVARATLPNKLFNWGGDNKQHEVQWRVTAPPSVVLKITNDVGDVTVKGFTAGAHLATDVGDIVAEGIINGVQASSHVGDIEVSASGAITARSDTGSVSVTVLDGPTGSVTASSDVGSVTVTLSDAWAGDVDINTDVGSIQSGVASFEPDGRQSDHRMRGAIGGGGEHRLKVSTDVGGVILRQGNADIHRHRGSRNEDRRKRPL